MKVAFLDRDGTIIRDYPDQQWKGKTTPEFLSRSIEALKGLVELGYQLIIITNQYLIGDGIITQQEYDRFTKTLLNELKLYNIPVLKIYYCPHATNTTCNCCKPRPGMILQAMKDFTLIDLSSSIFIGDSIVDIELANYFGISAFGINIASCDYSFRKVHSLYHAFEMLKKVDV